MKVEYINKTKVVDVDFALEIFNGDRETAKKSFTQYNKEVNDDVCLDIEEKHRITDEEAIDIIKIVCQVENAPARRMVRIKITGKNQRWLLFF